MTKLRRRPHRFPAGCRRLARAFAQARSGNVALFFAIAAVVVVFGAFGAMDISRAQSAHRALQDGLDAATLYAARSTVVTDSGLTSLGLRSLRANLSAKPGITVTDASFRATQDGLAVVGDARAEIPATIAGLFSRNKLSVRAHSEVTRASSNLEVALVLDTTGSMAGQRIIDLRAAASDLVDLVVKDQQTPYYSKVAVVPYSMAVNVGSYANAVRGAIAAGRSITGATRADPVVVTAPAHGFANGEVVYITGVSGMTQINNQTFTVANRTANTFALSGVNGTAYSAYSSGGTAFCTAPGCQFFTFTNAASTPAQRTHEVSTCVTERTGAQAYTDAPPSTARLGRNYPAASNPCPSNTIAPLSSNRTSLKSAINALQAGSSTAGHVGVAWGWYLVSPNFGYLFPAASRPAAYGTEDLIKVVVLMTDGELNSSYCNGVISRDSTTGSGSVNDKINCNAPNGHSYDQAQRLCAAMKQAGVVVYTVGLDVVNDQRARDLVNNCASSPQHVYLPTGGAALRDAFRAIAGGINDLRISR